ncbi:MAG: 50S ribosomal protein L3 N(5)-glutamine methyltransferase [Candidatus Wenzhouxiangella sp. M2_3B_020]
MSATASQSRSGSLIEWIDRAVGRMESAGLFFGHGTASAHDEACWMVAHVLGLPPDFDETDAPRSIGALERETLERLLQARIESRKPLAYLTGEAWFAGLRFGVNEHVLVPRSPLAEVVRDGLMPWLDPSRPLRVLDVGTGSGCIAIALGRHWPQLTVDAVDVSDAAVELATANAQRLGVSDRVHVFPSDVFDAVGDRRYDLIVSNPPYVPQASMERLPEEYLREPEIALAAGDDGLDVVRRLLHGAPDHLEPGGFLLLEVGEAQPQTEELLGPIEAVWLEFEHGGEGVVLLDRAACLAWREARR